ncbi:MAG TPA: hypothetical protein VFS21_09070 [Roseiflexaceae bacterium]|nr:hypothetical protein [Roseiflexaceae bacterium]
MAVHRATIAILVATLLLCLPLRASAAPLPAPLPAGHMQAAEPYNQPIPGLLGPVRLALPWIDPDSCQIIGLALLPEPDVIWYDLGTWFQWLGVQLWNRVAYPLIVWAIGVVQAGLNLIQAVINLLVVPGVNAVWRLFVRVVLWFNAGLLALWSLFDVLRRIVWNAWRGLVVLHLQLEALLELARGLAGVAADVLALVGTAFLAIVQIIGYVLGFLLSAVPVLFEAVLHPTEPEQVTVIKNSVLFQLFLSVINGFVDSKLGWAWFGFIGIFYIKFIKWLMVEAGNINT